MTTAIAPGRYVHCIEDESFTEVEAPGQEAETPCQLCCTEGRPDPYCVEVVDLAPCPTPDAECESDDHDHGLNMHVTEVQL